MGTINYGTSNYITLGYNCANIDYEEDFYNDYINDLFYQIQYRIKKEDFRYFDIEVKPGYYEGFYINIDFDFLFFDTWEEKHLAQKEITKIKAFLIECIEDFECVAVYPGWCTGYADYKTTLEETAAAVVEMRGTVKNTPTYQQYIKRGA